MDFLELKKVDTARAEKIENDGEGQAATAGNPSVFDAYKTELATISDTSVVAGFHDDFGKRYPRRGSKVLTIPAHTLGHVLLAQDMITYVFAGRRTPSLSSGLVFGLPSSGTRTDPLPAFFSSEIRRLRADAATDYLKGVPERTAWCFFESAGPYTSGVEAAYPCRLGLDKTREILPSTWSAGPYESSWTALEIDVAVGGHSDSLHRPTFADATWSYLAFWKPGGLTDPIDSTCGKGLDEVVTHAIQMKDVRLRSALFKGQWAF